MLTPTLGDFEEAESKQLPGSKTKDIVVFN